MTRPTDIIVGAFCCGGWMSSQIGKVFEALGGIHGVMPWVPPFDTNQYKASVVDAVRVFPTKKVALFMHSFACQTGLETCAELYEFDIKVDYMMLIDSVCHDPFWAPTMEYPVKGAPLVCDIFRSEFPVGVSRAEIVGGPEPIVVPGTDHNTVAHSDIVLARVKSRASELLV